MVLDEPVVVNPSFREEVYDNPILFDDPGLPTKWHPLYQSFVDDGTKCIAEQ